MTGTRSTWYFDRNGGLARRDVDENGDDRWTTPVSLQEAFPTLVSFGANNRREVGTVTGTFQAGPNELVLSVTAARWGEFFRVDINRSVRVDMATGKLVEYPAGFGAAGLYTEGWRRYRMFDGTAWDVLNTVTRQFIAQHAWSDSVFRTPSGGTEPLPEGGRTLGIVGGRLFVSLAEGAPWTYRIFDLDDLTTDGLVHGTDDANRPVPDRFERAWSMVTDPETWHARRPGGEFSRELLEAINTAALEVGTGARELLTVMNAESGLRPTAYHPAGRYGLLQLTAAQLAAAGWTGSPDDYLAADVGQLPAIRTHLAGLGLPSETDELGLWLALRVPGLDLTSFELGTVVAAPDGPRPELFATHGVADIDGDGRMTVDDMRRYLRNLRRDPRTVELWERTLRLGAIIPDWPNLTEVNEGDDMGIVRPSAARLGLTVRIIALQQQAGFDHEQVVSIDPPPGTLAPLTRPVEVTVNFEG